MSFATLPAEVLDAICEPLASHSSSLAAAARTCSALYPSSARLLYRDISASAFARNLPVVHTLAKNQQLARLVRKFSVTVDNADAVFRPFYNDLRNALSNMTGLFSLQLLVDPAAGWILAGVEAAPDAAYPHLEHFACTFALDSHLSAFLAHTPALLSLELSAMIPTSTAAPLLPATHIPLLSTYTGPASLLPVLGARPLTALYLSGDLALDDLPQTSTSHPGAPHQEACGEAARAILHPGVRVQVFSAITSVQPALMLESIAAAYPQLACLRLMTTSAFWDVPNMDVYSRIASALSAMPELGVFELSGMHWEHRPKTSSSFTTKSCVEKEWVSPPVTPRAIELDPDAGRQIDFDFGEALMEWSY